MLFPNFLFDEGLNDELVEPQFDAILSATFQEHNLQPTSKTMSITSIAIRSTHGLAERVGD